MIGNLGLIVVNRSWTQNAITGLLKNRNPALGWVLGAALLFLGLLLLVPFARELFQFAPMHGVDVIRVLVAGVASVLWFELYKFVRSLIAGLGRARQLAIRDDRSAPDPALRTTDLDTSVPRRRSAGTENRGHERKRDESREGHAEHRHYQPGHVERLARLLLRILTVTITWAMNSIR